ncbi:MAG: cation/acetate symporter, partial [Saprospiraceae bacterium]
LGGPGTADGYWFGIPPEGIGVIGMIINFITATIVSKFTPAPPAEVQQMVLDIRIPRGSGEAASH